ncbi:MAG TPA: hypothetical protein VE078_11035 [Thermoanaerobaculia bacterium]|nr:hypothetical protein [Thermoanaerobaculia bacterium]
MEDHKLGQLLRELPPERASESFTAGVMARLDSAPGPGMWRQPRLVFAAAALAAMVASAGFVQIRADRQAEVRAAEARKLLQELRSEHASLKQELQELSEPPVVYLGGDEKVDLVVDMSGAQNPTF